MNIPCLSVADIELPREVSKLYDLAYNFWWSWNPRARRLFSSIDPSAWAEYRNPVQMLINVERTQWEALLANDTFMASYTSVIREFESYMSGGDRAWFGRQHPGALSGPVAYFCMEYGLHECFNIYSGGLGVLAGDHCKSASDLGLPFVGVGLLYRRGYFRQAIDADGRQQHHYPQYDFARLPVRPAAGTTGRGVLVRIEFPGREVFARVWVAQVGRVPLLLLTTDIPENDPADRPITGTLYVRGREMRLVQEIVLGIGGVRALRELGIEPHVWHINEGHSALLQLERIRERMAKDRGATFEGSLEAVRRDTVFTTHTPVPAGNEQFDRGLVGRYLEVWTKRLRWDLDRLLALGDSCMAEGASFFNLTALALRTAARPNAVSVLHGRVSRDMWRQLYAPPEGAPPASDDVPIRAITNGIHTTTWLGMEMLELFNRKLGLDWQELLLGTEGWEKIHAIDDADLWEAHMAQKERLGRYVRLSLREQFARLGHSPDELRRVDDEFDPARLTIGFGRRFATYKRASLVFSDPDRLRAMVSNPERPVQIVLAGKAHPADHPAQELIRSIFMLTQADVLRGRIFFLEDYDMRVGRVLVQGVDVWLNTPRRPMEASGTSGQKAAANGSLNLSVLDGWWPEAYDKENGWAIGDGQAEATDESDARSLYELLEQQVIPAYYERDEHGRPARWIHLMKNSIASITPRFSTSRMVRDYVEQAYLPVASPAAGTNPPPGDGTDPHVASPSASG
jgi:starch phosphorylase